MHQAQRSKRPRGRRKASQRRGLPCQVLLSTDINPPTRSDSFRWRRSSGSSSSPPALRCSFRPKLMMAAPASSRVVCWLILMLTLLLVKWAEPSVIYGPQRGVSLEGAWPKVIFGREFESSSSATIIRSTGDTSDSSSIGDKEQLKSDIVVTQQPANLLISDLKLTQTKRQLEEPHSQHKIRGRNINAATTTTTSEEDDEWPTKTEVLASTTNDSSTSSAGNYSSIINNIWQQQLNSSSTSTSSSSSSSSNSNATDQLSQMSKKQLLQEEAFQRRLMELKQKYMTNRAISDTAYYILLFVYSTLILLGTVSNSLICLTVILKPKILSPRNIFIVNLAGSDLLLCVFTMPFSFIEISMKMWQLGLVTCKLVAGLQATSIFVSTISITAIALDRYKVIVYPTHQEAANGTRSAVLLLASVWIGALLLSLPLFRFREVKHLDLPHKYDSIKSIDFCVEAWPFAHGRGIYSVITMMFQYVLPITIVSVVYAKISDKLQKRLIRRQRSTQLECQQKRQLNLIKRTHTMLISVSLIFGLSWLPLNLLNVAGDFSDLFKADEQLFRIVFAICHLIGCSSACSNPILYGYLNENFRKEFHLVYTHRINRLARFCRRLCFRRRLNDDEEDDDDYEEEEDEDDDDDYEDGDVGRRRYRNGDDQEDELDYDDEEEFSDEEDEEDEEDEYEDDDDEEYEDEDGDEVEAEEEEYNYDEASSGYQYRAAICDGSERKGTEAQNSQASISHKWSCLTLERQSKTGTADEQQARRRSSSPTYNNNNNNNKLSPNTLRHHHTTNKSTCVLELQQTAARGQHHHHHHHHPQQQQQLLRPANSHCGLAELSVASRQQQQDNGPALDAVSDELAQSESRRPSYQTMTSSRQTLGRTMRFCLCVSASSTSFDSLPGAELPPVVVSNGPNHRGASSLLPPPPPVRSQHRHSRKHRQQQQQQCTLNPCVKVEQLGSSSIAAGCKRQPLSNSLPPPLVPVDQTNQVKRVPSIRLNKQRRCQCECHLLTSNAPADSSQHSNNQSATAIKSLASSKRRRRSSSVQSNNTTSNAQARTTGGITRSSLANGDLCGNSTSNRRKSSMLVSLCKWKAAAAASAGGPGEAAGSQQRSRASQEGRRVWLRFCPSSSKQDSIEAPPTTTTGERARGAQHSSSCLSKQRPLASADRNSSIQLTPAKRRAPILQHCEKCKDSAAAEVLARKLKRNASGGGGNGKRRIRRTQTSPSTKRQGSSKVTTTTSGLHDGHLEGLRIDTLASSTSDKETGTLAENSNNSSKLGARRREAGAAGGVEMGACYLSVESARTSRLKTKQRLRAGSDMSLSRDRSTEIVLLNANDLSSTPSLHAPTATTTTAPEEETSSKPPANTPDSSIRGDNLSVCGEKNKKKKLDGDSTLSRQNDEDDESMSAERKLSSAMSKENELLCHQISDTQASEKIYSKTADLAAPPHPVSDNTNLIDNTTRQSDKQPATPPPPPPFGPPGSVKRNSVPSRCCCRASHFNSPTKSELSHPAAIISSADVGQLPNSSSMSSLCIQQERRLDSGLLTAATDSNSSSCLCLNSMSTSCTCSSSRSLESSCCQPPPMM